jgi:2,3-bisphosphoglycerate-dependent phosphoglycerate mutase
MSKIFIFRHGQTIDNKEKVFSGWRNVDLTPEGIQEAINIAEKLKSEKPTKAYESDLIRSKHTLDIVLSFHPYTPIIADTRIKERNYGSLTGTNKTTLQEKDPSDFQKWHRSYDVPPPGGESIQEVEKRVLDFLTDMKKSLQLHDIIFISAHGNSIRPMRKYFEHLTNEQMCSYEYQPAIIFSYTI